MTLREALTAASERLAGVSDTPRLDAELLMAHALGLDRDELLNVLLELRHAPVPPTDTWSAQATGILARFATLTDRRLASEPVAYLTGKRDFWTITLDVSPGVLIPRPDSETLIEASFEHFTENDPIKVLDLGTGSGALLLAALHLRPWATGVGVDSSPVAVEIAKRNARRIVGGRAQIRLGNWAKGVRGRFDLILCNPPYIEEAADLPPDVRDYEPAAALFAGADGLDCYREIVPTLPRLLAPGGMIAVEIGHTQAEAVSALFRAAGLSPQLRHDLAGRPRAIVHFALADAGAEA